MNNLTLATNKNGQFGLVGMSWTKKYKKGSEKETHQPEPADKGQNSSKASQRNKQSRLGGRGLALIRRIPQTFRWGSLHSGIIPPPWAAKIEHLIGRESSRAEEMEKIGGLHRSGRRWFTLTNAWCHSSEQVECWRGRRWAACAWWVQ